MSRHSNHYGGSPEPPIESRLQLRSEASHFVPSQTRAYTYQDGRSLGLLSQQGHLNDQLYVSPRLSHPSYGFSPGGQPMNYPMDTFYNGNQQYYVGPPQNGYTMPAVVQGNNYTEWSSPDMTNSPLMETESRSSNNGSNSKSRRFSKRRNVKEGENSRIRSFQSSRPQRVTATKNEIRFSHQIKETDDATDQVTDAIEDISVSTHQNGTDGRKDKARKSNAPDRAAKKVERTSHAKKKRDKLVKEASETQLGVLIEQLTSGAYECMVCCDRVKQQHAVWSCENCFHVFHMICIKKWARSPSAHVDGGGWRCPGCQNSNKKFPSTYKCYCGKVKEPEWNRRETPHSCGEVCGKKRSHNAVCTHPCNILCHPGPCPQCPASVIKSCLCGKISKKVRCSQQKPLTCEDVCGKKKNCGIHTCEVICHSGECNECKILLPQSCFCGKNHRQVVCGSRESRLVADDDSGGVYFCEKSCEKTLSCGHHTCERTCHPGPCPFCPLTPENLKTCPCTRTKLADMMDENPSVRERKLCTDPIPTCGKVCGKPLTCGGESVHLCQLECHVGSCPPCATNVSTVICRCGKSEKEVPCTEIPKELYVCDRRCNKKRKCGRHKCGKICCTDDEHICMQICGRKLECKIHRCEETCHRGNCHTCYNVSFEELTCHCEAEVVFPPIPCGTKPPECQKLCARQHSCYHPVNHSCHDEDKCPPCVVLMKKQCNCGKVLRSNIPCHQTNVSCGAPCKKSLPCGHSCMKLCHPDHCVEEGEICTQPCSIMRVECIHPCALPCHYGTVCPPSKCKTLITLRCLCGNRQRQVECSESDATLQRLASESIARQHTAVDIRRIFKTSDGKQVLSCNEECATLERNRRLAEAFEIEGAKLEESEQQKYSPFLVGWVKRDPSFVQWVEQELTNLIDAISWLDQVKRSFNFPSMKRDKRQVVHELAEAMNCKSVSVDEEPRRSVVVTAVRGMSRIPRTLLGDAVSNRKANNMQGFLKVTRPDVAAENTVVGGQKRLLSSMKLVSMSSPTESIAGASSSQSTIRRPASIPKMPSHNTPLIPKTTPHSTAYSSMGKPFSGIYTSNGNTPLRSSNQQKSGQKTQKKDSVDIDYFDMIE